MDDVLPETDSCAQLHDRDTAGVPGFVHQPEWDVRRATEGAFQSRLCCDYSVTGQIL